LLAAAAPRSPDKGCAVLAIGKASRTLAAEAYRLWGPRIAAGLVVTLDARPLPIGLRAKFQLIRGSHPDPDASSVRAGARVLEFIERLEPQQTLLVLLSGGASAQVVVPRAGLDVAEIADISRRLMQAGAPIEDLNTVRRHVDLLKGGGLARAHRGPVRAFILSDVVGDPLHVVGSGPTTHDPSTFADAHDVLTRYRLLTAVPTITRFLRRGMAGSEFETATRSFGPRISNTVIGNNRGLVASVAAHLRGRGVCVAASHPDTIGEASDVGRRAARVAMALVHGGNPSCAIWGGEWTVTVGRQRGKGGPSQEAALAAAIELDGVPDVAVWTFSTDGRDGPTDFCGGLVDGTTAESIRAKGLDPHGLLRTHDSTKALKAAGALESIKATDTNLNHIAVAIAMPLG